MPSTRHVNLTLCCNSRAIVPLVRFFTIPLEIAVKTSVCALFVQCMDKRSRIWKSIQPQLSKTTQIGSSGKNLRESVNGFTTLVTGTGRSLQVYFLCLEK